MSVEVSPMPHLSTTTSAPIDLPTQSVPYLAKRYNALPIHHARPYRDGSANPGDASDSKPRAENALRRKTPNGTLNAGFDASADDSTQPLKHQLLPISESDAFLPVPVLTTPTEKRTFVEHERHLQQHQQHYQQQQHDQRPNFQRQHARTSAGWNHAGEQPWPNGQMMQHQTPLSIPSLGPNLYHIQSQQPMPHMYHNQTVPSVMQPSQQYVGPTASGGQASGPYGPYWHDGTFVPYRPSAIRDARFYYQPPADHAGPLPTPQIAHQDQSQTWQGGVAQFGPWTPQATSPYVSSPSRLLADGSYFGASNHTYGPAPPGSAVVPRQGLAPQTPNSGRSLTYDHAQDTAAVGVEYGPSSSNGLHRDKTFAWALQQYKDLLGFIHHTRRQQHNSRQGSGQPQPMPRPSFYPKPPRPSAIGSSAQIARQSFSPRSGQFQASEVKQGNPCEPIRSHAVQEASLSGTGPAHLQNTTFGPQPIHNFHALESSRRASFDQYNRSLIPAYHPDMHRPARHSVNSAPLPMALPSTPSDSPHSRALAAFQYMENLCQAADWRWIDGMHLGGCLAYGLGEFQRALDLFMKVLQRDANHLEATSNLAATLLALGRRAEAEQHWMKVVKVAPTYFEAVEHLVGLLCNEQRSRDAIKVIEYVERSLRQPRISDSLKVYDRQSECSSSTASRSPCISELSDKVTYDFDADGDGFVMDWQDSTLSSQPGFGSSGFGVPGSENGRILALIHAKGNMLYGLGDNGGAARSFEDAVLIATGRAFDGIQSLVQHILKVVSATLQPSSVRSGSRTALSTDPILLSPEQALLTAKLCFQPLGELPGLEYIGQSSFARKAVISTTSNSLLSLAKIFQDGMSNASRSVGVKPLAHGVRDILALYYLSLALQPSPSTANNVGILLASVQQVILSMPAPQRTDIPGVTPGSGTALALSYYNYGLQLDKAHAHLYTNLGSLLKDIGQLDAAINMYERAVHCDGKFDIALANLANAVKDKGRISDAIVYYKRAVEVSPDFAEAVCGLANALNSVCGWQSRGGIADANGRRDRWHVDPNGMLLDARLPGASSSGWIRRVVDIVEKQLTDGENWGAGTSSSRLIEELISQIIILEGSGQEALKRERSFRKILRSWAGDKWEGARVTRMIERAIRRINWHWYQDKYVTRTERPAASYHRPVLPPALTVPTVPTVLPFHTFTCPMSAKQIRLISQRNALRISVSTLRSPWLPKQVYTPPAPPSPCLRIGYVSSDFNNHPLAHLMQSVFGLHDLTRVEAYCYATTASDNSVHRQQIQAEAPVFHDASSWSAERLVNQIVQDGIHILVNLNGYTRGARNEVFAARPAPIQMSFMGFASTLGAEWCDYLLADETAVPVDTLRPWRRNVDMEDQFLDENSGGDNEDWVYGENIIYCRDTFFCCDHRQSAPDAQDKRLTWEEEQGKRWQMRKELFPQISDDTIIFGNFNQLYKIDPTTFRTWLRILARVQNSILWLLRFPDLGESNLLATARLWAGADVASRIIFTDVAPKHLHISRARVCDLVLDTAECNAHTTAADVLWSGTPLLTLPRYGYKMCSRMAASILKGALPKSEEGARAALELVATSEEDYEEKAVALGKGFTYVTGGHGVAEGRLLELRQMLFHARWSSALFDTRRWVRDLEDSYEEAWRRWVDGKGGDIWLDQIPRGQQRALTSRIDADDEENDE